MPEGYINRMGAVICFSEKGALFSAVVGISHTAPNIHNAAFANEPQRLQGETWKPADAMRDAVNNENTWIVDTPQTGSSTCVHLSKYLPIPCGSMIPPGFVGAATLGMEARAQFPALFGQRRLSHDMA
jgi:hypothetical protein